MVVGESVGAWEEMPRPNRWREMPGRETRVGNIGIHTGGERGVEKRNVAGLSVLLVCRREKGEETEHSVPACPRGKGELGTGRPDQKSRVSCITFWVPSSTS